MNVRFGEVDIIVKFKPYLFTYIDDKIKVKKFGKNDITKFVLKNKLTKIKKINLNILKGFNVKSFKFDSIKYEFNAVIRFNNTPVFAEEGPLNKNKLYDIEYLKNVLKNNIQDLFGTKEKPIGETAPDAWMEEDILLLNENEFDNNSYEYGINSIKVSFIKNKLKNRPSPSESATLFKVGYKKKGNDGNIYVIFQDKNGVKRWKKI